MLKVRVRLQREVEGMNWEAIGAVAEVMGAFGVIATLIYLAIQIRQNSRMMMRSWRC
jgi:hypothetical protein